jgi:hypothetical protein
LLDSSCGSLASYLTVFRRRRQKIHGFAVTTNIVKLTAYGHASSNFV